MHARSFPAPPPAFYSAAAMLVGALVAGCNESAGVADGGAGAPDVAVDAEPAAPKAVISATALDFGGAECGAAALAAKTFTIQNSGGGQLTWSATLDTTDAFRLAGPTGSTLEGGATATITVTPNPVPSRAVAGQQYLTTLVVTTSDPSMSSTHIPVSMSARGATIVLTPAIADFGVYTVSKQAPDIALVLTNTGNQDATVGLSAPTDGQFTLDWTGSPAAATVAAGASMTGLKARFMATSTLATSSSATVQVTGAGVCGASATSIHLKGQGTNGALVYSPGTIDFGLTDCGKTALTQTFTVGNTGTATLTWAAALGNGAPYSISPLGGLLQPGTQQLVTVVPHPIPFPSDVTANLYGATITLTTDAQGDVPHAVALDQTARGVIFTLTPPQLAYGTHAKVGDTRAQTVNNLGNVSAPVSFFYDPSQLSLGPTAEPILIAGGANQQYVWTALGGTLGPLDSTAGIGVPSSTPLCRSLPVSIPIQGTIYDGPATSIRAAQSSGCATITGNRAYCWGDVATAMAHFQNITSTGVWNMRDVVAVVADDSYRGLCIVSTAGAVSCRSPNYAGGVTTPISNLTSGVTQIAATYNEFCALQGEAVSCWSGGDTSARRVLESGARSIAMGPFSAYRLAVVMKNGGVLGGASPNFALNPVSGLSNVAAVAIGGSHMCALDVGGAVWCLGDDFFGQLNSMSGAWTPTPIRAVDTDKTPLTGALAVAAGYDHTCVVRGDHTVVCFGYDANGELGNGNTTGTAHGVYVAGTLSGITSISAGSNHTCARDASGVVSCWGINASAQVVGTSNSPSQVLSPRAIPYL